MFADVSMKLQQNIDLQPFNTFGLPGKAALFAEIEAPEDAIRLLADTELARYARLVLGGGSNMILTGDFPGLVLKVGIRGRRLVEDGPESRVVEAGAGENWHAFVQWTLAQGYWGLENLSLIPGSVGAAPVQNIGAYGLEMAERFESLDAVELDTGKSCTFGQEACAFGYRDSVFKQQPGRWLITRVRFRLARDWQPVIHYAELARRLHERQIEQPETNDIARAVMAIRREKLPDPAALGNAGSFFKNPVVDPSCFDRIAAEYPALPHYPQPDGRVKLAAGWLVDKSGWRGRSLGAVGCFERQALVLVNHGGAQGCDVRRVATTIQQDVYSRFGVLLETEPVFV